MFSLLFAQTLREISVLMYLLSDYDIFATLYFAIHSTSSYEMS